jgi:hypothetical protein
VHQGVGIVAVVAAVAVLIEVREIGARAVLVDVVIGDVLGVGVDGAVPVVAVRAPGLLGVVAVLVAIGEIGARAVLVHSIIRDLDVIAFISGLARSGPWLCALPAPHQTDQHQPPHVQLLRGIP